MCWDDTPPPIILLNLVSIWGRGCFWRELGVRAFQRFGIWARHRLAWLPNTCLSKCKHRENTYIKLKWIELSYMGLGLHWRRIPLSGFSRFPWFGMQVFIFETQKQCTNYSNTTTYSYPLFILFFKYKTWIAKKTHDFFYTSCCLHPFNYVNIFESLSILLNKSPLYIQIISSLGTFDC